MAGPLNDYYRKELKPKGVKQKDVARISGDCPSNISKCLKTNRYPDGVIAAFGVLLNKDFSSPDKARDEGFEFTSCNPYAKPTAKNVIDALSKMETCDEEDREYYLKLALDTVVEGNPAFLAIFTMSDIPSTFEQTTESNFIKESVFEAQKRGLRVLYVTPTREKLEQMKENGLEPQRTSEEFAEGCYLLSKSEFFDKKRTYWIEHDQFDITAWRYIMTLVVEKINREKQFRVIERGPASGNVLSVVKKNHEHERQMFAFVRKILVKDNSNFSKEVLSSFP